MTEALIQSAQETLVPFLVGLGLLAALAVAVCLVFFPTAILSDRGHPFLAFCYTIVMLFGVCCISNAIKIYFDSGGTLPW